MNALLLFCKKSAKKFIPRVNMTEMYYDRPTIHILCTASRKLTFQLIVVVTVVAFGILCFLGLGCRKCFLSNPEGIGFPYSGFKN